nr:unnamed protein product [Callosobruchus chinensis]
MSWLTSLILNFLSRIYKKKKILRAGTGIVGLKIVDNSKPLYVMRLNKKIGFMDMKNQCLSKQSSFDILKVFVCLNLISHTFSVYITFGFNNAFFEHINTF